MGATERDAPARAALRERIATHAAAEFVSVDAGGSSINLPPMYARAPRGIRATGAVPRNTAQTTTLIAARPTAGMGPAIVVAGATDSAAFERDVDHVLAPALVPGRLVALINLSAHKSVRVRDALKARGCDSGFLPSYSPDRSPIEAAFSKLKTILRRAEARPRDSLEQAIADALDHITSQDACGYFMHCGYGSQLAQYLCPPLLAISLPHTSCVISAPPP